MRIILSRLCIVTGICAQAQNSQKGFLYYSKTLSAESINQVEAKTSGVVSMLPVSVLRSTY
jgi:hypothetical protein